jgi:rare lipoprotein A
MRLIPPFFTILLLMLALSGCATKGPVAAPVPEQAAPTPVAPESKQVESVPPEPQEPLGSPSMDETDGGGRSYRVKGRTYYPMLNAHGYEERGIASWYGPSFQGCRTSSGETFDMHQLSAAHKLLPMHTQVSVTNLENGKSIELPVNDRGPFVPGRVIDLSYGAARKLGITDRGQARVVIRTSGKVPGQKKNDMVGTFFVHVGAFESKTNTVGLIADMKALKYRTSNIKLVKSDRNGELLWRVQFGPYGSMSAAARAHAKILRDYPSAFIVCP